MHIPATSLTQVCIFSSELTVLSRRAHDGAGKCFIIDLLGDYGRTHSSLQESKLWLVMRQAIFLTTAAAPPVSRGVTVWQQLGAGVPSPAQVPHIVPSIINREWKAPGEQNWRCRQYQSRQKCKLYLWQRGQMHFNLYEPELWAVPPPKPSSWVLRHTISVKPGIFHPPGHGICCISAGYF